MPSYSFVNMHRSLVVVWIKWVVQIGLCLGIAQFAHGQYFQFSQYNFSVQRVNPAWVGLTNNALVDFSYRTQKTGGNFNINTNFLSVAYPFVRASTGKPMGGVGFSILSDKSGQLFKTQEASASVAINIPTGRYQNLSLGFKGIIRWQRINTDGLFTGSQYLEGRGFDPALDNGEVPQPFQNNFTTFSSGLLWQETNRQGRLQKRIGFSFFDFNKPNPSFLDGSQDELPSTIVLEGAWRVYQNDLLGAMPELLVTRSARRSMIMIGNRFEYTLNKQDQVDVLLKYVVGRTGIAGIQFHRTQYSLGVSYDFPIAKSQVANLGAIEVGLEYRTPVDPRTLRDKARKRQIEKRKSKLAKRKKKQPSKQAAVKPKPAPGLTNTAKINKSDSTNTVVPVDSVIQPVEIVKVDSIPTKPEVNPGATAGRITHEPLLVEKITLHFRFDYNSTDLDDETEAFLNELTQTLMDNPDLSIQVTGHTDNVGGIHLNQRLSVKRAEAVKGYLVKAGVDAHRIVTDGKGMSEPLNANETDAQRATNRRVEIKLMRQ